MNLKDLKDVLTFAAFRPEPDDSSATWKRRFPGKRTLLLNVGRAVTTWRCLGKGGKFLEGGSQEGEFKDIATQNGEEWKSLTDEGWCAVSVNTRYVISLETNLSRKPGVEEIIRTNPRSALGSRYERGKRYAFTHNPESVASILLACDEEQIRRTETILKEHGLQAGRISCGAYGLLCRMLEQTNSERTNPEAPATPADDARKTERLYVVCCEGSICAMLQGGDLWTELRSRSDLSLDDPDPVLDILQPLISRLSKEAEIHFVAETDGSPVVAKLRERMPKAAITDHSQPQQLWRVLADL